MESPVSGLGFPNPAAMSKNVDYWGKSRPCGTDQTNRGRNYIPALASVHQPDFLTPPDGSDTVG